MPDKIGELLLGNAVQLCLVSGGDPLMTENHPCSFYLFLSALVKTSLFERVAELKFGFAAIKFFRSADTFRSAILCWD